MMRKKTLGLTVMGLLLGLSLACGIGGNVKDKVSESVESAKTSLNEKAQEGLAAITESAKNAAKDAVTSALGSIDLNKSFDLSIPITEGAVNKIIELKEKANELTFDKQLLKNMHLSFTGGTVVVTGQLTEVIFNQLNLGGENRMTVIFRPALVDGDLKLTIVEAKIGNSPAPDSVFEAVNQAQTTVSETLQEMLNAVKANVVNEVPNLDGVSFLTVTGITVEDGKMTIDLRVEIP